MAIKSKYNTKCPLCGGKISIGDWIDNKNSVQKWGHVNCGSVTNKSAKPINVLKSVTSSDEEAIVIPVNFVPSKFQENIFQFIINGKGHAVVEAVAGSGKTTTIVKALEYIPLALLVELGSISSPQSYKDLSALEGKEELIAAYLRKYPIAFLAFNKHIATELKKRAPSYVHVSTLHSLGNSILQKKFPGCKLEKDKVGLKMDDIFPVGKTYKDSEGNEIETPQGVKVINKTKRYAMRKLVALCKATLIDYKDVVAVQQMIDFYGLEIPEDIALEVLTNLPKIMSRCKSDTRIIDYDDMLWLPIVYNLQLEKFHYLLVDEFQDLNNCQIEYVTRSLDDGGRIVGVGDRKQSLYGFRGADVEAIPRMIKTLNATVLPLSISYRCPRSHVQLASGIVPQILASDTAVEGSIVSIKYQDFLSKIDVGDMIICRTNAPLIKPAFDAIRRGKKATIRGRDIGSTLVEFVRRFEADSLSRLDVLMAEYAATEFQKHMDRGRELQADMVVDQYETVKAIADECKSVEELVSKLLILFDDSNEGVVFSSVHRAKGLEARRVFILRQDLMPHPKAKQPWEQVQEENGQYVAYTRSKEELYFVAKE